VWDEVVRERKRQRNVVNVGEGDGIHVEELIEP
jgi:hypothetical protein